MNNKSTLQAGERSDCTVRALVKTAGLAYDDAWKWVSIKMQRRPRRGPTLWDARKAMDNAQQINGKKVKTLVSKQHQPGRYKIQWNATNEFGSAVATGMYIYKIQAKDFVSVKKLLLMK